MSLEDLDRAWARIEAWLTTHAPKLASRLPPPAGEEAIAASERDLGVRFPSALRASLARHGGESDWGGVNLVGNWTMLDLDSIGREHRLMKGLLDSGAFEGEAAPHPRIARTWWSADWIPIVASGSGHQICVDTAPPADGRAGQIILFLHDDERRYCLADSFEAWWSAIARGLDDGSLAWDPTAQKFRDQAFLSIALEGKHLYAGA